MFSVLKVLPAPRDKGDHGLWLWSSMSWADGSLLEKVQTRVMQAILGDMKKGPASLGMKVAGVDPGLRLGEARQRELGVNRGRQASRGRSLPRRSPPEQSPPKYSPPRQPPTGQQSPPALSSAQSAAPISDDDNLS